MIINKEEVEKAAYEYTESLMFSHNSMETKTMASRLDKAFVAGEKLAEDKVQKYVGDVIIENQGLKLYKDNEAERFKELAVEFGEFIIDYEKTPHLNRLETTEELYELFLKQRNEKN